MTVFDDITDRVEGFLDDLLVSERVRDQLARASRLVDRDNYDQAERLLEEARDSEPQVHRIHQLLGLCRLEQGEPDRAGEALDRALELREDPTSHFYAGLAAERTDSPEVARLHYHRALGLAEDHPFEFEVHLGLGRIYLELGRADRAANELEKALATDPDRDDARLALARAELRRGDVDAAGALVDQLLEGDA
ncbi:MAG: tetratricopeptide repeat protein, partial [Bradymonadaceae bacterium]